MTPEISPTKASQPKTLVDLRYRIVMRGCEPLQVDLSQLERLYSPSWTRTVLILDDGVTKEAIERENPGSLLHQVNNLETWQAVKEGVKGVGTIFSLGMLGKEKGVNGELSEATNTEISSDANSFQQRSNT